MTVHALKNYENQTRPLMHLCKVQTPKTQCRLQKLEKPDSYGLYLNALDKVQTLNTRKIRLLRNARG